MWQHNTVSRYVRCDMYQILHAWLGIWKKMPSFPLTTCLEVMGRTITEPCWTPNGGFPYYKRFLILEFGRTTCTSSIGVGYSQLSPQLITAEIEQMDAIANLSIEQYIFFNGCIIHFCNHQRQLRPILNGAAIIST